MIRQSLLGLAAYGSDSDSDASDAGAAGSVVIHKVHAASNLLVTYGDDEATEAPSAKAETGSAPAALVATPPPASTEPPAFIEARVFAGEKAGYVFMMDGSQLGYHLDNPSVARRHLQRMAGVGDATESIPGATTAGAARGVKRKSPGDDKPLSPRSAATISAQAPLALPPSSPAVAAAVHSTLQQLMPPSPPPDAIPHPEAVAMLSGISDQFGTEFFNSNLRSKKAFRNPSILSRVRRCVRVGICCHRWLVNWVWVGIAGG